MASKSKKTTAKKKPAKKSSKTAKKSLKQRIVARYKKFLAEREELPKHTQVPQLRRNLKRTRYILRRFWKPLTSATAVYGALYFVFVRVLTQVDINDLTTTVNDVFGDGEETFLTQLISVGTLFGESTNFDNQTGMIYFIVTMIYSLAIIWILRLIWAERKPKAKVAYYEGMYPLVPFFLVILFMIVQAIPFSIGGFFFQNAFNNGLAISFIEKAFFVGVFAAGAIISAYFIIGSVVAMYAVTVPGVTPSEARRTAKRILKGRRFKVIRQVMIFLFISGAIALVPMMLSIWLLPQTTIVMAAIVLILTIPWIHFYFYGLYRDLIDG